ncbi:MAG: hypothetical protein M3082_11650 [Candidatus Dormibacteraeota bacterium]|nr:hypothetical protein [Candidatus Dormibacteraeota bacterium]
MKRNKAESKGGHGKCIVCSRPDRDAIDAALATSSLAAVSAAFDGIGLSSLYRHKVNHAPAGVVLTSEPPAPVDEGSTHDRLVELVASCQASLEAAKQSRSLTQTAVHHREYRQALDDLHAWEVDAELLALKRNPPAAPTIHLAKVPGYREFTVGLAETLEAHDARFHQHLTDTYNTGYPSLEANPAESALQAVRDLIEQLQQKYTE